MHILFYSQIFKILEKKDEWLVNTNSVLRLYVGSSNDLNITLLFSKSVVMLLSNLENLAINPFPNDKF